MSDGMFMFLVLGAGVLILVLTSGFASAIPGLFNITNRINSKETTSYSDIDTFTKTMNNTTDEKE